jgi:hypothetical protein
VINPLIVVFDAGDYPELISELRAYSAGDAAYPTRLHGHIEACPGDEFFEAYEERTEQMLHVLALIGDEGRQALFDSADREKSEAIGMVYADPALEF